MSLPWAKKKPTSPPSKNPAPWAQNKNRVVDADEIITNSSQIRNLGASRSPQELFEAILKGVHRPKDSSTKGPHAAPVGFPIPLQYGYPGDRIRFIHKQSQQNLR